MIKSKRKYVSPKALSEAIVDGEGMPMQLGEEKDVGEFNINFLARVDEAISAQNSLPLRSSFKSQMSLGTKGFKSSLAIQNESFISKSFFGTQAVITHAIDKQNKPIDLKEESLFGQIMINPTADNIYYGWDDNAFSEIDDFVTHDNMKTKAQQEIWIVKAPNALFLQIQRVTYDTNTNQLKKIMHPIQFDKVIYIDRFLESNKKRSLEIRKQVLVLKDELKKKKAQLKDFVEFGNHKRNLLEVLDGTLEFLELQDKKCAGTNHEFITQGKLDSHINNSVALLKGYVKTINARIELLNEEIEGLKSKIRSAYSEMREKPYELHSIWAHSGVPESGHYIAYIHNKEKDKWMKYNDRVITEEQESNIFPAYKDIHNTQILSDAYCLLYIKKDTVRKGECKTSILPVNGSRDEYYKLLPPLLEKVVAEDNKSLDREIVAYKKKQLATSVCKEYDERIKQLQRYQSKLGCESFNFISYLYAIQDNLWKWELLDKIVKDLHPEHIAFNDLHKEQILIMELNKELLNTSSPYRVLELSPAQMNMIRVAKDDYRAVIFDWVVQRFILEKVISKEWIKAVKVMELYLVQAKYTSKRNYERVNDILKVLSLRLLSHIDEELMKKEIKEVCDYMKIVSVLCIKYIHRDDPHTKLIIEVLSNVINNAQSLFSEKEYTEAKELIQRIVGFPLIFDSPLPKDFPSVFYLVRI
jgi:ubiquitin carboxyl-terminal hydrolase 25/28